MSILFDKPELPKNRLIIDLNGNEDVNIWKVTDNGESNIYELNPNNPNLLDLSTEFGMILLDGYSLIPPAPKTYIVDIPGGNGKLDLTESLLGETAYDNRDQEFKFAILDAEDFEMIKTTISNKIHGRAFNYALTMDPGYTYHGRFTIDSYKHSKYVNTGKVGTIVVKIESKPYKLLDNRRYYVSAQDGVGGIIRYFQSGRKPVTPKFESDGPFKVGFNGKLFDMPNGTWTISDITFRSGSNELYLSTFDIHECTWGYLKDNVTWKQFGEKKLYEWYKIKPDGTSAIKQWDDYASFTWGRIKR